MLKKLSKYADFLLTKVEVVLSYDCTKRVQEGGSTIMKNLEELRKLKRRVKELEAEVEQLKKKDRDNMVIEIVTWTVAVLELATAIIALIATLEC